MAKGGMVDQYKIGDHVSYQDTKSGAVVTGKVVKLHNSCAAGVAEIRPDNGSKKLSRRLQHVRGVR